jgi:hypothetical protein
MTGGVRAKGQFPVLISQFQFLVSATLPGCNDSGSPGVKIPGSFRRFGKSFRG